jgi:hypothetical protein
MEGYDSLWADEDELEQEDNPIPPGNDVDMDVDPPTQDPDGHLPSNSQGERPVDGEPTANYHEGLAPDGQEPERQAQGLAADNGDPRKLPEVDDIDTTRVRRIIGHLTNGTAKAAESRQKAFGQSTKALLRYIAELLGLEPIERNRVEKTKLFEAIINKVQLPKPLS